MTAPPPDSSPVTAAPVQADATLADAVVAEATLAQLFAVRPYLWLWAGRMMNGVGTQIQAIALGWHVYAVARSTGTVNQAAFAVGMLGLSQFLPIMCLTLVGGDAADRYDRRKVMACALALQFVTAAGFTVLAWQKVHDLWPIYGLAALFGVARAFYNPSSTALPPALVGPALMPRAIVFNSAAVQIATISGPAVGGLLVAISPTLAFAVAGVLMMISLFTLTRFRAPRAPRPTGSQFALIGEGLAYVWTNKMVFGAISLDLFAVLFGGATALLPVFARDVLHVGPQGFGILRAAPAIGSMLVGFRLAVRPIRSHVGLKMFLAVASFGLATVVFALSRSMVLSVIALAALGAGDMISVFVRQTLVQIVTPNHMRGRVAAASTLFIGASNELGEFESGGVARVLGPVGSALFGGIGAIAVTGIWAWLFPDLRKADRLA